MGREIVYCWKCATRLRGEDFDNGDAFKVGDKVSCSGCVDELVADLSAEEQEAILAPPQQKTPSRPIKKISSTNLSPADKSDGSTSRRTSTVQRGKTTTGVQKVRTGTTGPIPTTSGTSGRNTGTGVRKKVTASIPKVQPPADEGDEEGIEGDEKPPMDEKKKKLLLIGGIGGGLLLVVVVLLIVVLTRKDPVKNKPTEVVEDSSKTKATAGTNETPKEKEAKALLKAAFDLKTAQPEAFGLQLKKFREAEAAAAGLALAADISTAIDDVLAKLDKAIAAVGDQVKQQYSEFDYKTVLDTYEKAKAQHDVPEWTERIDTKIKLTRNRIEDTFHQFKRQIEDKTQAGEDPEIGKKKAVVAKWELPEYVEKFDKFVALIGTAPDPGKNPTDPGKTPPAALNVRQLTPAMKAFMPSWQNAIALAFGRDYAGAVTEMTGAAARAESDEAKKAGAEDVEVLKALGDRYQEILKVAAETPNLTVLTLEFQDKPGEWKKVTGKTVKVQPTRMEFQPDPVDKKPQPAIFIEFSDLNAGSLVTLYKARKKTLPKKDADLLAKFALIEGAPEAAQAIGAAPDRFWIYAAEAREKAPKPNSREFEARVLFHQSEFEWRKSITKYNAIEKSKLLMSDYTSTAIVRRYQPAISKRAETGKEYVFLPGDLVVNGDYNTFKAGKKEDPQWLASKQIDFKDSLFNFVEAEFIALPGLTYKCWVYAGGCCQEVWNGSFQATEMTTKNRGKDVPIDPGVQMAAPLPMPISLKKTHEDHKPSKKGAEHPKNPAKWDWIQIPLPKTFLAPGAKQVRILTDQQGFAVKYVIISSSRPKSPDDATAKELQKEAVAAPAPKLDIKGEAQPKQWFLIGPFAEGLSSEQAPEKEIELGKAVKGKNNDVKWKLANATLTGQQVVFDWDKNNAFNPKVNVSVYALIHIKAPAALDARLFISHDDGGRAWLNGTKVHDNEKSGGGAVKADEFSVAIKLEEGWNRLLIKVNQGSGAFGLMTRITDAAKAPIAGLEYSPYGDSLEPP